MQYFIIASIGIITVWAVGSYLVIRTIEQPTYTVLEKREGYEIRQYDAYIVAESAVSGSYDEGLNEGFRAIADYIFGNNTTKTSIAMTSPVLEQQSEKIAMTVPVISTTGDNTVRTVSFVLPAKYTLETLPLPNNEKVKLREVPPHKVAVRRFTWYATEARIEQQKAKLVAQLTADSVVMQDTPVVAQYNPPISFPLTRRNEVMVTIE
jgi:SOUL heme-binding protein